MGARFVMCGCCGVLHGVLHGCCCRGGQRALGVTRRGGAGYSRVTAAWALRFICSGDGGP